MSKTAEIMESLTKEGDTFLLKQGDSSPNTVHQAVNRLRSQGYTIETDTKHEDGTLYTVVGVPKNNGAHARRTPRSAKPRSAKKATKRQATRTVVKRHPDLGATLRVTTLGEHPDGGVILGLQGDGRFWVARLDEDSDQ